MRLLIASPDPYLPEVRGGGQLAIRDQCAHLRRLGVELRLLAGRRAGRLGEDEDAWEGQPVVRAVDPAARLAAVAEAFRADLALLQVGLFGRLHRAARAAGLPAVGLLHNAQSEGEIVLSEVPLLAVSTFAAARAALQVGRPVTSVGEVIDLPRYAVTEDDGRDEVLFVNPLPSKGFFLAAAIAREMPATRFHFLEGWHMPADWRAAMARTIAPLANVTLSATVDDMRPIYRRAAALLVPSVFEEAWGRVVTEAQHAGIPVLASDRGALPEAVGDGGIVLPLHAPVDRWTDALATLTGPAHGAWAAAARRRAADPALDPARAAARLLDALRPYARAAGSQSTSA